MTAEARKDTGSKFTQPDSANPTFSEILTSIGASRPLSNGIVNGLGSGL